jgi:hypothetical protein
MNTDAAFFTAAFGSSILVVGLILAVMLLPTIFYIIALQRAMSKVREPQRPLPGGLAWIGILPGIGIIWIGVFQLMLSRAIEKDFELAGRSDHEKGGFPLAVAWAVAFVASFIPVLGTVSAIACLVLWILLWVKYSRLASRMPV